MTRADLAALVAAYEHAWRSDGTDAVADLFTADATYQTAPFDQPHRGHDAIVQMWEAEREGPDEVFTMKTDVLAVDGDTGIVRAEVAYGNPTSVFFRDLWIVRLDDSNRCFHFEEWPFMARQRVG